MSQIVTHIPTLKGMEKAGLIKFHNQTGTKITGLYGGKKFTCTYIDEKERHVPSPFLYKGRWYDVEYFSGCFCPYVVYAEEPKNIANLRKMFPTESEFLNWAQGKLKPTKTPSPTNNT